MPWSKTFRPSPILAYEGGPTVLGKSEQRVALQLKAAGVPYSYGKKKLKFSEHKERSYTPDFQLSDIKFIEVKGLFEPKDRVKHLLIKDQYPEVDVRFIFDNSGKKLSKTSKTTYAAWCSKHGFQYADKVIPPEWLN